MSLEKLIKSLRSTIVSEVSSATESWWRGALVAVRRSSPISGAPSNEPRREGATEAGPLARYLGAGLAAETGRTSVADRGGVGVVISGADSETARD